jgi:predicted membrane channel-forming protein YqfA (hemolysin III family)
MSEKTVKNEEMSEENVVAKVAELMETLDHVKKYNALAGSFKRFALIVLGSIAVFLALGASLGFLNIVATLDRPQLFLVSLLLLLVPITGIALGVVFIRRRVNAIKTGEWKEELSQGFPSALKMLMEMDWDEMFDEISSGRVSYALYGLLKMVAYWIITVFAVGLLGNLFTFMILHRPGLFGVPIWGLLSFLIVYLILRKDLSRRYNEIRALDKLLWELRWFSLELRRAEFQT